MCITIRCKVFCFTPYLLRGELVKNLNMVYLLDFYKNILSQKQREMLDMYYNDDLSLAEISEIVGITRQGVRDSIKRGETELVELETRLELFRKFKKIKSKAEEIKKLAQSSDLGHSNEITKLIDELCDEI